MAKMVFSGVEEEVVTREEFPLKKAQEVLKDELVAVLGYGVQGPAQALNMRENGVNVIVGVNEGGKSWKKALADGWVPGETLFSLEEAAERGTVIQYLVSDAAQKLTWAKIKPHLHKGDALYFSHGFAIVYKDQTGVVPPEFRGCDHGGTQRIRYQCKSEFSEWQRDQQQFCRGTGFYRPRPGTDAGSRYRHRLGISICYFFQE